MITMEVIKKGHTFKYVIVPVSEINAIWEKIKIEVARTNDEVFNEDDVKSFIDEGYYTLWLIIEIKTNEIIANFTTEYAYYPRNKICRIVTISGNRMNEWAKETLSTIEKWAVEQGCSHVDCYGRKGWKKILTEYLEHSILFRKQL